MPNDADDFYTHRDGHWKILPWWAKLATILIGLPAFLLSFVSIFFEEIGSDIQTAAFAVFLATVAFQGIFIVRAYWRMDL